MRWRSPNNPALAALVVASETAWLSLCIAALATATPNFSMDVPYLTLFVPGLAAVLVARLVSVMPGGKVLRYGLLLVASLLVLAVGAGALGARTVPGAFTTMAFDPFSVRGRVPSDVSTISWLSVTLVAARGIELGLTRGGFRQVGRSAAWTLIFYLTLFVVLATNNEALLHRATRGAGVLFLLSFFELLLAGHLMRSREAAASGVQGPAGPEARMWGAILVVPVVVVVGLALAATAGLGAYGGPLATGVGDGARGVGDGLHAAGEGVLYLVVHVAEGIGAAIGAIVGLFLHHPVSVGKAKHTTTNTTAHSSATLKIPPAVALVVALGLFGGLALLLWRLWPRKTRPPRVVEAPEVLTNLFTWKHLFKLLFAFLGRLLKKLFRRLSRRLRRHRKQVVPPGLTGVRGDYLRVLVAARDAGRARFANETPREFAARLSPELDEHALLLASITTAYEQARYAGVEGPVGEAPDEERPADVLVLALAALAGEGRTAEPAPARPSIARRH